MSSPIDTQVALKYFKTADPIMATLLEDALQAEQPIKIPVPQPESAYFHLITKSIVSQQISVGAAAAVFTRVRTLLGEVTPKSVLAVDAGKLKACGLSIQKTKYIRHNAEIWHTVPTQTFKHIEDKEIIKELIQLYGIGRWTAEMFLMFSMARPNVFSYGDYALMQNLYTNYSYKKHWVRKIEATVDAWSPHKTLASLTLWHHKDKTPL